MRVNLGLRLGLGGGLPFGSGLVLLRAMVRLLLRLGLGYD